jgi:Na+-translocating ferredoxin:NAD+ oxidoreductase RnfG subunit
MAEVRLEPRVAAKIPPALRRIFGPAAVWTEFVHPAKFGARPAWRVESPAGVAAGAAMVDEVPGKSERITILVATDRAGVLKDIEVLAYRESYGGEVAQESWRAQFRGRKAGEPLRVGRQIRNISGATISTNSVAAGVARTLAALAALVGKP